MISLVNHGEDAVEIRRGDRVAQVVFQKVEHGYEITSGDLDATARGALGFGSTGV